MERWLKLKDAAKYSSIGRQRLVKLALDKSVKGFRDPGTKYGEWIFDKQSIDEYRMQQMHSVDYTDFAITLLNGL